tara:strand:+ start:6117 stop:6296 length:180 start_codon:yes stop_codon:yes gene_type:complete
MMTREEVPDNSVTNGGNGGYMNNKARVNMNRDIAGKMEPKQTATGRSALNVTRKNTKIG